MTGRYKAYPEYKDSGVEWVGKIPSHWGLKKLKYLAPLISEKAKGKTNPIALEHIQSWTGKLISTDSKFDGDGTKFKAGDILFGKLRPYLAKVYLTEEDGEAIGDFHVMRPINSSYGKFLKSLMLTTDYISTVDASTYGAKMPRASWDFTSNIQLPFCSETEAEKITNFLDHETAKIDSLIAKQEMLIELLKEKRQAVISHAVTKGLNSDAPMKNSGVEWLGEVPEHWVVCCLKHIKGEDKGSFVDGPFGSNLKSEHFVDNGDVYVIESNFATTGLLDTTKLKTISTEHFETISRSETTEGAIIIAKIGARYGMNSVMPALDKKAVVSGNSLSLKINDKAMDVQYCHHLLTHLKQEGAMDDGVNVTAQPALSLGQLNNLPFLRPSKEEQQAIVNFVQQQEKSLSSLILNAERMIELSRERKTALISAAVTGKIDVRDWQPQGVQDE
ncbi:restriction endonuclease subunit S [Vibrio cholerae]|uniref:restriction endonuclease subunit S n=1 Tax=Vibrio cholerae TaxID=666 RepID=UPI001A9DEC8F|nr:restriction endonuclease subunit S [Vibrio cholerae]MBO1382562.1 hypothetical protein [Vibrio cholerae]MBO1397659.1 hypothetical protein [Vibrio cholerae]